MVGEDKVVHTLSSAGAAENTNFPNKSPEYDTKQSDRKTSVMLGLWGSTLSLPLLSGSLWPGVVAPDRVQAMGQKEMNRVLTLN